MEIPFSHGLLRPWQWEDATALVALANNRRVSLNMRDAFPYPYTTDDADRWLTVANKYDPPRNFAVVVDGSPAGGLGLVLREDVYRRSAEIGYWLGEPYWGRGIMTTAVQAAVEYAFATFDICRLFAGVFDGNAASGRVLEKAGFTLEARLRKVITKGDRTADELVYAIVR
ncbi:MAG TPA: GNAT family N-acetyltransferase [Pirellulales bacterium]|jgi:RimJ/RimL family protein N-acetyltransferase